MVGEDTAVLGSDIIGGILEEEVNIFDCCCQGQVGFSGEESVNVEDGGEDDEQEGGAKGFPSSEDSLDAEGCVPGAQAIEGGEQ